MMMMPEAVAMVLGRTLYYSLHAIVILSVVAALAFAALRLSGGGINMGVYGPETRVPASDAPPLRLRKAPKCPEDCA